MCVWAGIGVSGANKIYLPKEKMKNIQKNEFQNDFDITNHLMLTFTEILLLTRLLALNQNTVSTILLIIIFVVTVNTFLRKKLIFLFFSQKEIYLKQKSPPPYVLCVAFILS